MNEFDPNKKMNEEPLLVLDDATNREISDFLADPSTGVVYEGRYKVESSPEEEYEDNYEADGNDEDDEIENENSNKEDDDDYEEYEEDGGNVA